MLSASTEVRLLCVKNVLRFWDKGQAVTVMKKKVKGLAVSLDVKKREFVEAFDKELR